MAFSKISTYILYVVGVLSLVIMLFFYISPNTVNIDELDLRVEQLTSVPDMQAMDAPAIDTVATDSLDGAMAEADSAAAPVVEAVAPVETMAVHEIDLRDHMTGWEYMVYKRTDLALKWAYILLVLTALAAVVFPLINLVTNMKALLRTLMILAGAAVLVLISYFVFSNGTPINIVGYAGTDNSDPGVLRMVGTSLYLTYILFGVTILSILYSEIAKLFK
jgi:hypothetical protein